ncbi:MAG TPA: tetraacyldisaccharide 4'-kinase [Terriglobales bacterium]
MNPLTALYSGATALRNTMFDRGVLSSRRLEKPVVSVGNLSVGGSGKTPFVIAIGGLLKARGIQFDVLSRGYGRKTRGVRVVETDGKVADFGDEPLLIARQLGVPVIVGESRYEAGRVAERKFQPQLHILDDGFQHRSLARDFDIVLMGEDDFDDRLLPSGRLREPLSSLQRADAIVLPQGFSAYDVEIGNFARPGQPVWRMSRQISIPAAPIAPIVFCGIARPQQFFAQVRATGVTPAAEVEFRDHHAYNRGDIERLLTMRGKLGADGFLTTQKDAVNLGALSLSPLRADLTPFAVAVLSLTLDHPTDIMDAILLRIAKRKPRS